MKNYSECMHIRDIITKNSSESKREIHWNKISKINSVLFCFFCVRLFYDINCNWYRKEENNCWTFIDSFVFSFSFLYCTNDDDERTLMYAARVQDIHHVDTHSALISIFCYTEWLRTEKRKRPRLSRWMSMLASIYCCCIYFIGSMRREGGSSLNKASPGIYHRLLVFVHLLHYEAR